MVRWSISKRFATKKANAALIVLADRDEQTELSFRNFGNIHVMSAKDVNPVALLTYKYVVVAKPEEALKALEARVATKTARKAITVNRNMGLFGKKDADTSTLPSCER
jgi:ribosomal protein L4